MNTEEVVETIESIQLEKMMSNILPTHVTLMEIKNRLGRFPKEELSELRSSGRIKKIGRTLNDFYIML